MLLNINYQHSKLLKPIKFYSFSTFCLKSFHYLGAHPLAQKPHFSFPFTCLYFTETFKQSFQKLRDEYVGPVGIDYLTKSTVVVSERTRLSLVELETGVKTELIGSATVGGYVDGERENARFRLINDLVVQGKSKLLSPVTERFIVQSIA